MGPLLQTHKLLDSVDFARRKKYTAPLTAAELEMMNLTGDGNGFDMVTMPQTFVARYRRQIFFSQTAMQPIPWRAPINGRQADPGDRHVNGPRGEVAGREGTRRRVSRLACAIDTLPAQFDRAVTFGCARNGASMGRRIVLLSDGTGNSAAKVWRTNVWRVFESIDLSGSDQVAFYDDGVGTSSFKPLAILGGACGYGLKRNVMDIYKFACRNYRNKDDEIYGFGFSRGAFTMRIVAGLIIEQGLVWRPRRPSCTARLAAAYRAFRREQFLHICGLRTLSAGFVICFGVTTQGE